MSPTTKAPRPAKPPRPAGAARPRPAALVEGAAGAAASTARIERRRNKGVLANPAYDPAAAGALVDAVLDSPIGPLRLVADDRALWAVYFPNHPDGAVLRAEVVGAPATKAPARTGPSAATNAAAISHPILRETARQLEQYFAGTRRDFDLPLATGGTEFQQGVWKTLRDIPFAATWSYGQLATRVGNPNASRAVGAANGMNPIPIIVPCHRVIGANGTLTGFGGGEPTKRWLLDHEARVAGLRLF
jgi:methylated-DNA-[protein]-cysteine S-methyltransferase